MLKAHGWQVHPGGVDVCTVGGPTGCGAGVATGTKLQLNLLWATGLTITQEIVDLFQSDADQAGVKITTRSGTFGNVLGQATPCVLPKGKGTPACNWQLVEWGGIGLSTYPDGAGLFNTGGGLNVGSYSNPKMDTLINETTYSSGLSPFFQYENLVVQQEPFIMSPSPTNIFATASNLAGYGLTGSSLAPSTTSNRSSGTSPSKCSAAGSALVWTRPRTRCLSQAWSAVRSQLLWSGS